MRSTILHFSELYPKELSDVVFRYSSPTVFEKTLSKKTLWFTRGDCFNDYEDGEVVKKLYLDCLGELLIEKIIDQEFYVAAAITKIKHLVWLVGTETAEQIECKPFICCFSQENDSLQMWQYYSKGGNYEGYNIGFRLNKLLSINPSFVDLGAVVYDEETQKKCIKRAVSTAFRDYHENLKEMQHLTMGQEELLHYVVDDLRRNLAKLSCFFKRPCFSGEKEIRVIINVPINEHLRNSIWSGSGKPEEIFPIRYRIQQALMIPYIEVEINPLSIEHVMIGPITSSNNIAMEKNKEVINEFVYGCLGRSVPVMSSAIPIRF